jgi:RND family efflux transporter MFP subunit
MQLAKLFCLLAAACQCLWPAAAAGAAAGAAVARPAPQEITLTGFTRARAEMALVSEAAGRCREVTAEVGEAIGAQGVFARLDATFTRLELEANLVEQKRLASRVDYLATEARRARKLVAKKSQAQAKLDAREQELDQARLQLAALKVQEKTLRERLARHTIPAPSGWRIIRRMVEPGQWVAQGQTVARAGDFRTLLVPLALTPAELEALRARREITLRLPRLGRRVEAAIERVSPAFDPATRKINLDLAIAGGLPEMRGGLLAELTLELPDPAGAVLVPAAAVSERYQEHWLTTAGGQRLRVVVLGPGPEEGWLRVSAPGLEPGQELAAPE